MAWIDFAQYTPVIMTTQEGIGAAERAQGHRADASNGFDFSPLSLMAG